MSIDKLLKTIILTYSFFFAFTLKGEDVQGLDIRFMGTDLVDELVFSWTKKAPFPVQTALTLVELSAPIGLDNRFQDAVENRLYELLRVNPNIPISLVYCGVCQQAVTYSSSKGTVLARGIDNPQVFDGFLLDSENKKALSLRFEAEGQDLVLFAHIFEMRSPQRILWAERYSISNSARSLLRAPYPLLSMEEARTQQKMMLEGREPYEFVTRFLVHQFSSSNESAVIPPLVFFEQNVDSVLLPDRKRRVSFGLGFMSLKNHMEAWSVTSRIYSLMMHDKPSLSQPDFYWFAGFSYTRMRGEGAFIYGEKQIDFAKILDAKTEPKASLITGLLGLEVHVKNRYGLQAFIEYSPSLSDNKNFQTNTLLVLPYHAMGGGMVWRW